MKKLYIRIFTVAIILFTNSESDLSAQWDTISTGTNADLYAVQFINVNTGWIAGTSGKIQKTTNGGTSWISQNINSSKTLRKIIMFDANTGYICGDSGKILKTTNGGSNWNNTNTSSYTVNIHAMDFINASTGICANESRRQFKTTNSGLNWTNSNMNGVSPIVSIFGIDMADANTVFASTSSNFLTNANVYKSSNFGSSYNVSLSNSSFSSATFNDVKFINSSTGYAGASNNNLARTTNGGTSWTVKSFPKGINQISFPDPETGYICGEVFFKAKTDDGGDNWAIDYNYKNGEGFFGISFINSATGWMCGSGGLLIKTTNGGGIPASCNIENSSWVNLYENQSASNQSVTDDCGNIFITGYTGSSNRDILTQKYSSSGYLYWSNTYNGPGNGHDEGLKIIINDYGNLYVAGNATGSATGKDLVLIKYLSDGQREWVRTYDTLNHTDEIVDLEIDNSGNPIIIGNSTHPTEYDNFIKILKYNSNGNLQWVRKIGNDNYVYARAMVCNSTDDIYLAYDNSVSFNPALGVITKLNSSGTLQWSVNDANYVIKELVIGNSGNLYVTGNDNKLLTKKYNTSGILQWETYLNGSFTQEYYPYSMTISNGGQILITGVFNNKTFTVKYDSDLALQWSHIYDNPHYTHYSPSDITTDIYENIYIIGFCSNNYLSNTYDMLTMKYNSTGTTVNMKIYGDSAYGERGNSINIDNAGNVFAAGYRSIPTSQSAIIKYSPLDFSDISTLNLTALIQGFYNSSSDLMIQDTVRVYLRNNASPYAKVDSAVSILSNTGGSAFIFSNAVNSANYYLVFKHRNSIETWSKTAQQFTSNSMTYNFSTANTQAYGDNMIQADNAPVVYAVYSGDVNQDGTIDLTDGSEIDNDAFNFNSGYLPTDVNGDEIIDVADAVYADNNGFNFVGKITP